MASGTYNSRAFTYVEVTGRSGDGSSRERQYLAWTDDGLPWEDAEAFDAARAVVCPAAIDAWRRDPNNLASEVVQYQLTGISLQELEEREGAYSIRATYGAQSNPTPVERPASKVPEVGTAQYEFDVSLENVTFKESKTAPEQYHRQGRIDAANFGPNPTEQQLDTLDLDLGNRINVNEDNEAEGVETLVPVARFTVRYAASEGIIDGAYQRAVEDLVGKVNADTYLNRPPGSLLFQGASGSERNDGSWEITFSFLYKPNVSAQAGDPPIVVGSGEYAVTIPDKDGWDYLWVRTVKGTDANGQLIRKPDYAFVHQVYDRANFSMDTDPDPGPLPPIGTVPED